VWSFGPPQQTVIFITSKWLYTGFSTSEMDDFVPGRRTEPRNIRNMTRIKYVGISAGEF
jgi:hypothetical protein